MLYAIVAVIAIIMDQLIKLLVETNVPLDAIGNDVVRLIPGFIHITNIHNYGAAFSFLQGARWFFVVLCIVFVLVVIYVLAKDIIQTPLARWMAVFVLAGAVGNCIDRIICGYVVDMFEFEFFRFPVFNLADIYITCGAIVFCLCVLLEKPKTAAAKVQVNVPLQAETEAAPAKARKPLLRKRQKVEIPVFPKHEPKPDVPAPDPNDPFAEWEKRASAPKEAPAPHVSYTQPAAAEAPAAPVVPEVPKPAPAAPAEKEVKAAETYDLDDILAEFKDL